MNEMYLLACTRYLELNPVRAGLVKNPEDWHWSSAGLHIKVQDDILVTTKPLLEMVNSPWEDFLAIDAQKPEIELFRKHERTGRPLEVDFLLEQWILLLDRKLKPQKPGPKKKDK